MNNEFNRSWFNIYLCSPWVGSLMQFCNSARHASRYSKQQFPLAVAHPRRRLAKQAKFTTFLVACSHRLPSLEVAQKFGFLIGFSPS